MQVTDIHPLQRYLDLIMIEFPDDKDFGISFLADSEEYADTVEPLTANIGVNLNGSPEIRIISHFDYRESLLDNQIFTEVNRCTLDGLKFLKIITPLFTGDSHDIILAPERYLTQILYKVKGMKDIRINSAIHAPLIDLPLDILKRDILDFLDNEEFATFCKQYSIKQKRGFIFAGPPGNGKTLSISWLKSQAQQRNILFTAYKSARDYLESAENGDMSNSQNKKIIVFEEFDTYLQEREVGITDNKRIESNQVMGSILQLLDGIEEVANVVFIFTTNFISTFDAAIMRPGRIDKIIKFEPPQEDSQLKFFQAYLKEYDQHKLILDLLNSGISSPSYATLKSVVDNIRIQEFWLKQEGKKDARISEDAIKNIISAVLANSNHGNGVKSIGEYIL